MPKTRLKLAVAILTAAIPGLPLSAWGVLGHQMAATAALQDLPPGLAHWFEGREDVLRDHANDPDHWKQHDPLEGPRHYLDAEAYGGADQVPLDEGEARTQLGAKAFEQNGQVPWAIQARVEHLASAFADRDPDQVAFEASILSHYVADLSVPLHTTRHHDGMDASQHGVHHRWEGNLLERIVEDEGWAPEFRPIQAEPNAWAAPWAWLRDSYELVPQVLADDRKAAQADGQGGEAVGRGYWKTFQQLEAPIVKEQLTLAANRTAQMIALAWTKAGAPLPPMPRPPFPPPPPPPALP